jgi:hypothetical protein
MLVSLGAENEMTTVVCVALDERESTDSRTILAGADPAPNLALILEIDDHTDIKAAVPATETLSEPKALPMFRPITVIAHAAEVGMNG